MSLRINQLLSGKQEKERREKLQREVQLIMQFSPQQGTQFPA